MSARWLAALALLAGSASAQAPPPPPLDAPPDATVLFEGRGPAAAGNKNWTGLRPGAESALDPNARVPGLWPIEDGALVVPEDGLDLLTTSEWSDLHLHLDFLAPHDGQSGVLLAGRWEVQLAASRRRPRTAASSGAIFDRRAPLADACAGAGVWQSLDIAYAHRAGEDPRATVWLNDEKVQDDVTLAEPTPGGFATPLVGSERAVGLRRATASGAESTALDWGAPFTVSVRFRSRGSGTLVSKCPPEGEWVSDAKALFLRGGHLVYDIGWVGALHSRRAWNDGEWHTAVLTYDGVARLYVDGELEAERDGFTAPDREDFVLKLGAANSNFGGDYQGDLARVAFARASLSDEAARALSSGASELEDGAFAPPEDAASSAAELEDAAFAWSDSVRFAATLPDPADPVPAPLRLQAGTPGFRFANVWVRPLGEVDHAGLIESWDTQSFARGEAIYGGLCVACHGADGERTTNPKARPFATAPLQNGHDPLSLFATITDGWRDMPGNAWLRPDQRYDVIHYLRERFLRRRNPAQFFALSNAYLNALPKGRVRRPRAEQRALARRDYGPALASQLGDEVGAALSVRLDDDATIAYDLQTLDSPAAWTGGFLDLARTQHHQQRGEGRARAGGPLLAGLEGWGWGHGGTLAWDRARRPPRGPLPTDWLDYHGHALHGDRLVLRYAVDGRELLELPGIDRSSGLPVITHRLRVEPGEAPLVLRVVNAPRGEGEARARLREVEGPLGAPGVPFVVCDRGDREQVTGRFAAAAVVGGGRWRTAGGEAVLEIDAADAPLELWVLRLAGDGAEQLAGFRTLLENLPERGLPPSPATMLDGGPARWDTELVTAGTLGEERGAYALDTLTLPPENPWNAWLRTSALDFFEDGRAAVATYGGDVWIVSGIDAGLGELRWRRFAAGMFEPMGLRVIDGLVHVTCRDRIVRLRDVDGDGEADAYDSFFADPDVSPNFHAFNFDLQTDAEGALYYAKSGQYTDFDLGGAILRVAPDGGSFDVFCTGLRTPNGMGMSPDGRPLVSDNQGNWVPASKISLTRRGGFYGVFPAIDTNQPGLRTRAGFDPPVLWMPQGFDSSSGGQLWVDDARFGPLTGRYLHTSFGKGWMFALAIDDQAPVEQAAAWRLPFQFAAGIQRLRTNPGDGQVYTVGLSGWQGPSGGADGCLQRVRYTGRAEALLLDARVRGGALQLDFAAPLEAASVGDRAAWSARAWNYRWTRGYGSAHYRLSGGQGEDQLEVRAAFLAPGARSVRLELEGLAPCDQLAVRYALRGVDGAPVEGELLLTLNSIPGDPPRLRAREECADTVGLPWTSLEGGAGPGAGKHVVLIAGDEEYRSEECLPALARILSQRHGFRCTVLYSVDPQTGTVDPMNQTFTPGLEQLADADLVVLFTRFREWPDRDMRHFVEYVESGRPLVGIRTATHAFDYRRRPQSPYSRYSWRNDAWPGGFGRQVLGETWVAHHGGHGSQATRGVPHAGAAEHPILRGVRQVFGPTDVYTVAELPPDAQVLLDGQVLEGMTRDARPVDGALNDPPMPLVWTRELARADGGSTRVVTSTIGSGQGFEDEGLRRLWVNACYWALGLEEALPAASDVRLVGDYAPTPFGYGRFIEGLRPADLALSR